MKIPNNWVALTFLFVKNVFVHRFEYRILFGLWEHFDIYTNISDCTITFTNSGVWGDAFQKYALSNNKVDDC